MAFAEAVRADPPTEAIEILAAAQLPCNGIGGRCGVRDRLNDMRRIDTETEPPGKCERMPQHSVADIAIVEAGKQTK